MTSRVEARVGMHPVTKTWSWTSPAVTLACGCVPTASFCPHTQDGEPSQEGLPGGCCPLLGCFTSRETDKSVSRGV